MAIKVVNFPALVSMSCGVGTWTRQQVTSTTEGLHRYTPTSAKLREPVCVFDSFIVEDNVLGEALEKTATRQSAV
ncbi:hypothetical protein CEXT_634541 [Caerostris extrusa]|uniref:Secreted protein n=1 Tax=Caerostris extrusa TaxID=172846 RepID=A0AAV4U6P1_CAEEX|nr:hypothetical protein CEXT_634541 [Caerostris extrusa]